MGYDQVFRADGGYYRREDGATTHLEGCADTSPRFKMYDGRTSNYDPACSWCWLGYGHSELAHLARVTCSQGCECSRCAEQGQQARAMI